ncbi:hypothetical protein PVAG01_04542 [Phlyctema vagabunda]|uniref:Altered inheritance of mitochondria protein 9, mitochondrial n=1 Tax=Phlyctema vagabunda TaxID=108571 RepID=A0ABR4PHM6_9HELO
MASPFISKFVSSIFTRQPQPRAFLSVKAPSKDPLYPILYTSGRWLHRDEEQCALRHIDFSFPELCKKALKLSPDATHIISYEKKEGGFNKVFIFHLNNGTRLVARLPTRAAGPPRLTTNSEVATIKYVRSHTSIPVPHILDWSDDSSNAIGSEYIIMNHVEGVQLQQRWATMSGSQYTRCVQSVCMTMKQLAALEFPAYGSLYFKDAPIDPSLKVPFADGLCIGPHCSTTYWDHSISAAINESPDNSGPWQDLSAYSSGLVTNKYSKFPCSEINISRPSYFGKVDEHRNLLQSAQIILQNLITQAPIQIAALPTLLHPDLHARNIYVKDDEPTSITCLIDWQSSSIEPAFIYAGEVPDFAMPPSDESGEESTNSAAEEPTGSNLTEEDIRLRKVASYCSQAYDICTKSFIPKLRIARSVDPLLVRPFQYANTSWRDSTTAVRQEFIELADRWYDLDLAGPAPYNLTPTELETHEKGYKAFEHVQKLKVMLMKMLGTDSDGWVPLDRWEEVRRAHKAVFEMALETAREGENASMSEDDVRELWPFDGWKKG